MAARKSSGPVLRSISPSPRFNRHSSSPFASATASAFTTARSIHRPTPVNPYKYNSPSLSFSVDRPGSPNRSISFSSRVQKPSTTAAAPPQKRTCMCSPTNHPGSFRCSLHKGGGGGALTNSSRSSQTVSCATSSSLNMRRSAMKNSLVRIGTVEGELEKRALAALIRPSSHQQRRRCEFRCRPTRLSVMTKA